jgi:hypothetical protein
LIAGLGSAAAWPARAHQAERLRLIEVLIDFAEDDQQGQQRITAFRE